MVGLPQLRLPSLLGCSPVLSQERCAVLVGRLQLYVRAAGGAVVVDGGSGRAWWMMQQLAERWREA
jgi:hypothetical protein